EGASSSKNPAFSRETEFRDMLFKIAEEIGEDDLKSLKEQCGVLKFIPKGPLEKKKTASEVFESLRERTIISNDNTEKLEELLKRIGRNDLVKGFVSK
ncbi:caspase-8-like, partial [Saccoglossus kowalevskii]